ncbi:MAG: phenylalanine--tRNA ligase subunit beta [Clostridia bacterium]|nr:phenylalanine--tRNA ligase subunit beta [Clostridia bacterium]
MQKHGAELPGGITIKKGKIRGEESNGMLCSMQELGLENKFLTEEDKNGIHELSKEAKIGEDPIKYLELEDEVIDFELTANRGDLLSILGMAYEIGAIYDKPVKTVDTRYNETNEDITNMFKLNITTNNCSIFLSKKVKNVCIKESPNFIKNRLIASGIRPINNVVDISNYVMLETGQPLHFYDADTLKGMLEVRMAEEGENLTTLDGIKRELSSEDIVISDGAKVIGLAGVMGGLETEVTDTTKDIIIEAAIFDAVKVRCTSKKILRSEASNRFEKGLDPNGTYLAINRACHMLEKYADAEIVGGMAVYDTTNKQDKKIKITFQKITDILGLDIPKNSILDAFRRLGFSYEVKEETITVLVPTRRIDISIPEDLIEEVGRIYGVDNIEGELPVMPLKTGTYDKTIRQIRNKMIDLGLNETLSYVLVNDKEAKQFIKEEEIETLKLLDPLTEERNTLRASILPSLYKIYEYNVARNVKEVAIFEIGKSFYKKQEQYEEERKLGGLLSGEYYKGIEANRTVDFYITKGIVEELLDYLGYGGRYSFVISDNLPKEFHPGQTAQINLNGEIIGIIGKVHPKKANEDVFVFEINLDKLLEKKTGKMKYKEISKYPSVKKDLSIVVEKEMTNDTIKRQIKKSAGSLLNNIKVFDVYTGTNIEEGKKSISYSLEFSASDRTLTDEETNKILEKIIIDLEKTLGAKLRK